MRSEDIWKDEYTRRLRDEKLERLKKILDKGEDLLVAFSGGLDSGFLAKVATDLLGEKALCVTLDSETMPRSELSQATEMAKSLSLNHRVVTCSIFDDGDIAKNPPDRCYICKRSDAKILKNIASEESISRIADGVNLSDYDDYRPGIRATDEGGIIHPLAEAGITKSEIRTMAEEMGLPFWDKPPMACLASRIPYGEAITHEKLRMAELSEEHLKGWGIRAVRVRVHGRVARIEVPEADLVRILGMRAEIVNEFKKIGFLYISLDLEGYRTGSMNEVL